MGYGRLAWGSAALTGALVAAGVCFTLLDHEQIATDNAIGNVAFVVPITAFAIVGALIAARRPENRIGWICVAIGLLFAIVLAADGIGTWGFDTRSLPRGLTNWIAWPTAAWVPALGLLATQLPLRIPDGRPLNRLYSRVCAVIVGLVTVAMFLQPPENSGVENPTAAEWADPLGPLFLLIPLCGLGALASVIVRYRRSGSFARHQLRWIALGALVFVALYVLTLVILLGAGVDDSSPLGTVVTSVDQMGYAAIPVAIGFAVLRRRLYDIDVVINRALVYSALTVTLGAAYFATVLVLGLVLTPLTHDSGLAVAASTLAVAGLFRPARARIQDGVDRRFYRCRYDAARTLQAFGASLRDELDLDALSAELR